MTPRLVQTPAVVAAILGFAIPALLLPANPAWSSARDQTVETLKGIAQADALGIEAWLDGALEQVRVGDEVGFRFRSQADVYLTTIYVDASGSVSVLHTGKETHRVQAGETLHFPAQESRQRLVAQLPLGSEIVFAIATLEPLPQEMFLDADRKLIFSYERPEDGRHLAQRIADYVSVLPDGSVDVAWFSQEIVPENTPKRYSSASIVEHFTTQTRSLSRPKLDLDIQFRSGSDQLTERARIYLDQLGRALEHPAMKSRRFELAGHTDDVGAATANMKLSQRRAKSALDYLTSKYEIDPSLLRPAGYGEAQPLMPGTSDDDRRRNRRVVLQQLP